MSLEGEETTLSIARSESTSLRTSVPMSITRQLGLQAGDKFLWKLEAKNNEMIVVVRPIKISARKTSPSTAKK